jgi:hypothetical protein
VKEQGRSEGADSSQTKTEPKEQGRPKNPSEAGKDYRDALRSIRANQDLETFVADLRQNKEQLLSFAQELKSGKAIPAKTAKEAKDNIALGIYMDFSLRVASNPQVASPHYLISNNSADWPDEDSQESLTDAERREILVEWATRRIASKWLDTHPDSFAANTFVEWGAYAFYQIHPQFLQEMWPVILPQLTSQSEKKK